MRENDKMDKTKRWEGGEQIKFECGQGPVTRTCWK